MKPFIVLLLLPFLSFVSVDKKSEPGDKDKKAAPVNSSTTSSKKRACPCWVTFNNYTHSTNGTNVLGVIVETADGAHYYTSGNIPPGGSYTTPTMHIGAFDKVRVDVRWATLPILNPGTYKVLEPNGGLTCVSYTGVSNSAYVVMQAGTDHGCGAYTVSLYDGNVCY